MSESNGTAELIARAAEALDHARHANVDAEALDELHAALLALAGAFEVTGPPDLGTVATWYALDAAAFIRATSHDTPRRPHLAAAEHAILTARACAEGAEA